jgi:hypothetical protein
MEMLATEVLADGDLPRRTFYLCQSNLLANLAEQIEPTSRFFGLFLALDARGIEDVVILDFAREMINKGMACLCTWGPDCERVHDLFDSVLCAEIPEPTDRNVVMTTWHSDEPLREALWYFAIAACPAEDYWWTCTDWVAGCVGNSDWENTIRNKLVGLAEQVK